MTDLPEEITLALATFTPQQETTFHLPRGLVFEVAVEVPGIGPLTETTKWGEPAYLTEKTKSGSTLRIAPLKGRDELALFVNCQTNLIEQFKSHYREMFEFQGTRALVISSTNKDALSALKHCIALTLLYHVNKR